MGTVSHVTNADERKLCPACKKPVDLQLGVYRVRDRDYHRECFEAAGPKPVDADPPAESDPLAEQNSPAESDRRAEPDAPKQ
jgi:hypothetical protein